MPLDDLPNFNEGAWWITVDSADLDGLAEVRVTGLPKPFKGRKYKADCILVARKFQGAVSVLRLRDCKGKDWLARCLEDQESY